MRMKRRGSVHSRRRKWLWALYGSVVFGLCLLYGSFLVYAWDMMECNEYLFRPVTCHAIDQIAQKQLRTGALGHGTDKQVISVQWGCSEIAIKYLQHREEDLATQYGIRKMKAHAHVLQYLTHPNLVSLINTCISEDDVIVAEKMVSGNRWGMRRVSDDVGQSLTWALSLTRLARYFSQSPLGPLMHCDYVPHNFMLNEQNELILVDVDSVWSFQHNNLLSEPAIERVSTNGGEGQILARDDQNLVPQFCDDDRDCMIPCSTGAPESSRCNISGRCEPFNGLEAFVYDVCDTFIFPLMRDHRRHLEQASHDVFMAMMNQCKSSAPEERPTFDELVHFMEDLYEMVLHKPPPSEYGWRQMFM